ncbi:MAG: Crp/Fnr family transcriptional regulator [Oscillospiraceae bacterium]|nr:Crp/Fnr family transcriptional regulator [Oscillospiraceae bacterium]
MKQRVTDYRELALFDQLEEKNLRTILHCLHSYEKTYRKGEFLIMDQDHVRHIGIVLEGTVQMLKQDLWGNQTLFAYINPGQLLGEQFAVQKEPNSYVSFVAATDVRVLIMTASNIIHSCPNRCPFHHQLTENMFDLLGKKSVSLMEKIEVSSKPSLREKLQAYLSIQAQKQNARYITVPLNRTQLAAYLGVNRSAMTRELAAMQREGLVEFDKNTFVLKR